MFKRNPSLPPVSDAERALLDDGGLRADDYGVVTVRFVPEALVTFVKLLNEAHIRVGNRVLLFEAKQWFKGQAEIQVTELEVEE